ncbi:MAG: thermonuclease family protein [Cyanobacteria bacterium]|nr:thermonuclease family protein [Cyanobacteriota bacterium]
MKTTDTFVWLAAIVFYAGPCMSASASETFSAKVLSVIDGDTLKISAAGKRETVILQGIDCPELTQDYGPEAKRFTEAVCSGKMINVECNGRDRHGRTIVTVYLSDGVNLNQELVKRGLAWWSDKFAPNDSALKALHSAAKNGHAGLWSKNNPIPPWIFRNGSKSVEAKLQPKAE